jgi:hypothetical protein
MKFLSMYTPDQKSAGVPPSKEMMEKIDKFVEESMKAGKLLATGGLLPTSKGGARVRCSGGEITVTDGPFTEAKEVIAGFALLEAKSKEEAIEMAKRFLQIAGDGESDLRQIMEPGTDFERP